VNCPRQKCTCSVLIPFAQRYSRGDCTWVFDFALRILRFEFGTLFFFLYIWFPQNSFLHAFPTLTESKERKKKPAGLLLAGFHF
jgi:hypothetical protein